MLILDDLNVFQKMYTDTLEKVCHYLMIHYSEMMSVYPDDEFYEFFQEEFNQFKYYDI
jgi:uncharacterized protein YaaW (UPF0174 family)